MSRSAWAYIYTVFLVGLLFSILALTGPAISTSQWITFAALVTLATGAQLYKAIAPGNQSYSVTMVFIFAGVLLLHPFLYVLLIIVPHAVEWVAERIKRSSNLPQWYIQPFNIATHIIAGTAAHWVHALMDPDTAVFLTPSAVLAVTTAALAYVIVNHYVIGQTLVLARRVTWRESGVLDAENVLTDFIMLLLGYVVAVLWHLNAWLIVPALSPLVLIHRALQIPALKKEASTDAKTGLWNARHFANLFAAEMERAKRFDRPLSVIMADLDLLRNINNTYGHLAGDKVLAGIGHITRNTVREYDIAGRFGGEEFAIALPETGPRDAIILAERLREAVEATGFEVTTSTLPIHVTMSLGIASFPYDAATTADLIHEADVAVYQAKLKGRNCVVTASDVPHYIKLETRPVEDRVSAPYVAAFIPRPVSADGTAAHDPIAPPAPKASTGSAATSAARSSSNGLLNRFSRTLSHSFVGIVIAAGVVLTILGLTQGSPDDLLAIGLLTLMAGVAEVLQIDLYGNGTVSVSVAIGFAAALIAGLRGASVVSAAIALSAGIASAHNLQRRFRLERTAFNWATHLVAASAPVLALKLLGVPLAAENLLLLALPMAVAALAYYFIDTVLIAGAISFETRTSLSTTWRERYRWLADHYLVLSVIGLFLGIAYTALGVLGIAVFAVPVIMMRYAQKQYVDRTKDSVQELKRLNLELTQANRQVIAASQAIHQLNDELFLTLGKIIDARDPYVLGHAAKVADYATALSEEMGLAPDRVENVRQGAFLHDIGKIAISERVLHKPARLTEKEYDYIKSHVTLGAEFLETSQGLRHLAPFVKHHHERWDGQGYPDALAAEEIPLEARILSVCDAVEAMASDRPYHRAMLVSEIVAEIKRCAGSQFDPGVVETFVRVTERLGERLVVNSAREVVQKQAARGLPPIMAHLAFIEGAAALAAD